MMQANPECIKKLDFSKSLVLTCTNSIFFKEKGAQS